MPPEDECPSKSYAVLEARDSLGGTWDLFRYPGIRSDSDMFTLGFRFEPWTDTKTLADGPAILSYVRETARKHGVEDKIRYRHRVVGLSWSSDDARWTVKVDRDGEQIEMTAGFVFLCSGYFDYAGGYTPEFDGLDGSAARWCTRRSGPRTWTTRASGWWSSAAAPPRSRWSRRWPTRRRT